MVRVLLVYCLVAFFVIRSDATVNNEVNLGEYGPASSVVSTRETLLPPDDRSFEQSCSPEHSG